METIYINISRGILGKIKIYVNIFVRLPGEHTRPDDNSIQFADRLLIFFVAVDVFIHGYSNYLVSCSCSAV